MVAKVLLGNMACFPDFGDPLARYQAFLKTGLPPFRSLIESILLFDQIAIPTNDFMPPALLLSVLGEDPTRELLEEDVIRFARFTGHVGYIGNGGGIRVFHVHSPEETPKMG